MTRRGAVALAVALLAGLGIGAAIAGGLGAGRSNAVFGRTDTPSNQATPVAGIQQVQVSLIQPRYLQTRRMIAVSLRNDGNTPVRFAQFQLDAPLFSRVPPTLRDTTLEPGAQLDIPINYGEAQCDASPDGDTAVITSLRTGGGDLQEVRLPLPAPDSLLQRLHGTECGQLAIKEAVDIDFGPNWERHGTAARGALLLRRQGSNQPITVVDVGGTVIFTVRPVSPSDAPLFRLDPDTERGDIPIEVTASRCDSHAMAESKKSFVFPLWVRLGDAPEQYLTIEPQDEVRSLLTDLMVECAAAARA
jgi:hypothetical protein